MAEREGLDFVRKIIEEEMANDPKQFARMIALKKDMEKGDAMTVRAVCGSITLIVTLSIAWDMSIDDIVVWVNQLIDEGKIDERSLKIDGE